ncbi:DedA family protein [Vulgatibacter sp.]|uniref:DedA family protein n=1 Tax=Vulgatibacter sp. TaxID=1971226 RepID=UPI0035676572
MEQFVLEFLGSASGLGAYGLVFGVLLACGLGLPLPEDVALITGGYLAYLGHANLGVMLAVGFAGILAGDSAVFFLGRTSRSAQRRHPGGLLGRHLTPDRIAKVEAQFERRGNLLVVIARFLPGIRAATYFVAGGAGMSYRRFIFFDGLAALLSAPLFVVAGWHFGKEIGKVVGWAEQFHSWLIGGMVVVALALFARSMARRRRIRLAAQQAPVQVVEPVAFHAPPVEPTVREEQIAS